MVLCGFYGLEVGGIFTVGESWISAFLPNLYHGWSSFRWFSVLYLVFT